MFDHEGRIDFALRFRSPWIQTLILCCLLPLAGCGSEPSESMQFANMDRPIETGIKTYIDQYDSLYQIFYLGDGRRYQRHSGGLGSPLPPIIIGPNPMAYRFKPCWTLMNPMQGLVLMIEMNPGQSTGFPVRAL